MPYLLIGIDDTDWEGGGCTTYVMYSFMKYLISEGSIDKIVGLPRLTRLNPYVPFKTRGNASLSAVLRVDDNHEAEDYVELMQGMIDQMARRVGKTSPGIAYLITDDINNINDRLVWFYRKSVNDVVTIDLANRIAEKAKAKLIGGRGVIGALASLGFAPKDATYEFIAYRTEGSERPMISVDDVTVWDNITRPLTFLNIDGDKILIEPHGPDPVLFGVRGDSPYHVLAMGNYLANKYSAIGWILYITNQGTNAHMTNTNGYLPYTNTVVIDVIVNVRFDEHGHANLILGNGIRAVVYRHLGISGSLLNCIGCLVQVWGSVKPGDDRLSIYVEGIRVIHDRHVEIKNPKCPVCGGSTESLGRDGLLRCRRCGFRGRVPRIILPRNAWFTTDIRRSEYRHLMKPFERVGLEGLALYMPKPSLWIY
ncbi:MAG: DUF1743 domain-containing protein [Vulcanisaeta sp. AZ3]|jgi:tRNA(Ile2)-agmatinylcytidine synthase